MANTIGFGGSIGIGEESAWGTAVSRTNWMRAQEVGLRRTVDRRPRGTLGTAGASSLNSSATLDFGDMAGGRIVMPAAYDDTTVLFAEHGIGANATTGVGPYTHTNTLTVPNSYPVGLTIEQIKGTRGANTRAEVFEGCVITEWGFQVAVDEAATFYADVIAETSGGATTGGSPTYSSNGERIMYHHGGNLTWGSLNDEITGIEVIVRHNFGRLPVIGSRFTTRPLPVGPPEILINVTRRWDEDTVFADYLDASAGDAAITFTGSGNNALTITGHNARCIEYSDTPINTRGVLTHTFTLQCFSDGTDEGIAVAFTNDNAANTAN